MSGFATEGIIVGLFHSFLQKREVGLEQSMKVRDFVFDYVEGLVYKWHTVSLNRFGSHIDSPKCLKNKKATINPQNKNDGMIGVFCNLKKHPTEIIDCEKKEMLPLTKKQENKCKKQNLYHTCKQEFDKEFNEDQNYSKVQDHCHCTQVYQGAACGICNLRYKTPKEILVVLCNGYSYDHHFTIKKLVRVPERKHRST